MKIEVIIDNLDFATQRFSNLEAQQFDVHVIEITKDHLLECNLSPIWVLDVSNTYVFQDSRKMLNNISDRGYISFERESNSPKAARLYNFYGALRFAIMRAGAVYGIAYEISSEIADTWVEYISENFDCFDDLDLFTEFFSTKTLLMTKDYTGKRFHEIKDVNEFNLRDVFEAKNCGTYCSFHRPMFQISEILSNFAKHIFSPNEAVRKVNPRIEEMLRGRNNAG